MILRPYQIGIRSRIRSAWLAGHRRVVLVAPTGAGKTVIASDMMRHAVAKGSRVVFLAHRTELIDQASAKLRDFDVAHSVIVAGGHGYDAAAPVQVASKDTLHAWHRKGALPPAPDLVIVDECHRSVARTYADILAAWSAARVIGLTATPYRGDGKGLGRQFDAIVVVAQIHELIASGALVKPRILIGEKPDLSGVRKVAGDYNARELEGVSNTPILVGNAVDSWLKHASGRPTIVFATGIDHSKALAARFDAIGVPSEHVDGGDSKEARKAAVDRFRAGETTVLCNCDLFTEGFDATLCSCVILARPTKSLGLYLQMAGRALRPHPGKTDCIVLDLGGCFAEHGHVSEPRVFSLADDAPAMRRAEATDKERAGYDGEEWSRSVVSATARELPIEVKARLVEAPDPGNDPALEFYLRETSEAWARGDADALKVHLKYLKRFGEWPPQRIAKGRVVWQTNAEGKKRPVWV